MGDGDDIITEFATINGIAQNCFSGRAKGKFLFYGAPPFNRETHKVVPRTVSAWNVLPLPVVAAELCSFKSSAYLN